LAVSPSEQILIRIQGAESGQTSLPFKDEGTGSRRVSVDDTHSKRRGSGQSFVNSATPGGVRLKKGSLVVGGGSLGSSSVGQEAEAIPTGRSSESCQGSLVPINVDQMDVVETVGMLFDEMDQIMTRMAEMFAKYISTDQFSNLLKESDEICFQAQEVCRVELDRRCSQRHHQFHQQQQHQHQQVPERDVEVVDIEFDYECKTTVEPQVSSAQNHFEPHTQTPGFNNESKTFVDPNDRQQTQSTPLSAQRNPSEQAPITITTTTDSVFASVVGPETVGDYDDRQVKKKDSKDRISHLRNRNHYKHQYRYQPQGRKPGDTDVNGEVSSEEHQGAVYDYVSVSFVYFLLLVMDIFSLANISNTNEMVTCIVKIDSHGVGDSRGYYGRVHANVQPGKAFLLPTGWIIFVSFVARSLTQYGFITSSFF
jgi:hypothetical protein